MRYTVLDSVSVARSHCAGFLHVFRAEGGKGRMTKVPLNIRRLVQANEVHAGAGGHTFASDSGSCAPLRGQNKTL